MSTSRNDTGRLSASLIAGSIAITVNTALLAAADAIQFTTARGGLLRLLKNAGGSVADAVGADAFWSGTVLPATAGPWFQTWFHVAVGLLMAVFYAYVLESRLPGSAWSKGLLYALLVWLMNAFGVLVLLGEGIAGSRYLGLAGMIGFAIIHTVFFVLLALIYARLRKTLPDRDVALTAR